MTKINKHIEIARTTHSKFSVMGVKSCQRIVDALSEYYEYVSVSIINDQADLDQLVRRRPDLVFLGLKRLPYSDASIDDSATDIWLADYLDAHNIAYTGAAAHAMKLDFNKESAKARVRQADLPTPHSFVSVPDQYQAVHDLPLPFPLFIKPLGGGGGRGVNQDSVVRSFAEFQNKVEAIHATNGSSSLVEQYLEGREFSVAIVDGYDQEDPQVMPIEITTSRNERGDRILGYHVKTADDELVETIGDEATRAIVSELAVDVYKTLGGRDLGRIDIRMDGEGNAHFLEANFMPAPGSRYFAGAFALNDDLSYPELLFNITELALSRNEVPMVPYVPQSTREALAA